VISVKTPKSGDSCATIYTSRRSSTLP